MLEVYYGLVYFQSFLSVTDITINCNICERNGQKNISG
jgi:hypothetical protein